MNYALADLLTTMGYPIGGIGEATAHIVTDPGRPARPTTTPARTITPPRTAHRSHEKAPKTRRPHSGCRRLSVSGSEEDRNRKPV